MFKNFLLAAVFALGLAAIGWIVVGYLGSNPLGTAVALLIGACYLAGAWELHRYRQATATLQHAVEATAAEAAETAAPALDSWLARLHPALRQPVRLRIEGERVALPAPVMTPYLVGLLVLLGMLGTLLGMMVTLRGTGIALQSATDLSAIRGSLAAPVNGLGFAFGTSIAGVASSAMLGLLSALCRRERLQVVQALDVLIATTLRRHSQAYRREASFRLLQQQSEAMPVLVERLGAMMASIEQQQRAASEQQQAGQEAFHRAAEASYQGLARSVGQALKDSVADSARATGAALQPVVEATMANLAREAAAMHDTVTRAVQQQLDGLAAGFEQNAATVAGLWNEALTQHRQSNAAHAQDLGQALQRFSETFEQRSAALLERVASQLDASAERTTDAWSAALARQDATHAELATRNQQALAEAGDSFAAQAASLVQAVDRAHAQLQSALQAGDDARLAAWAQKLDAITAELDQRWTQAGEQTARQQQAICAALEKTAGDITAQSQAHASQTIAEITRLVDTASEAPRVAAEVVAELRQKLSDSMVRDTAMLEERSRLLATLETLLDAVNHASTEQRSAVDALVSTSADLLDRVGARFAEQVGAETGKLDTAAAQLTASAVDVASLGDAFGAGVAAFGQSSDALVERLQQVATALDSSLARSDDQLAYYVAQAREVVDLSVLSQQQIIEDLQQLAGRRGTSRAAKA